MCGCHRLPRVDWPIKKKNWDTRQSCRLVTFETLITILTIENLNSWQSFVTWQLRVTLDSIRNSCDVLYAIASLSNCLEWVGDSGVMLSHLLRVLRACQLTRGYVAFGRWILDDFVLWVLTVLRHRDTGLNTLEEPKLHTNGLRANPPFQMIKWLMIIIPQSFSSSQPQPYYVLWKYLHLSKLWDVFVWGWRMEMDILEMCIVVSRSEN